MKRLSGSATNDKYDLTICHLTIWHQPDKYLSYICLMSASTLHATADDFLPRDGANFGARRGGIWSPRFWQNRRSRQAARRPHATNCPPRFSDLAPSLLPGDCRTTAWQTKAWQLQVAQYYCWSKVDFALNWGSRHQQQKNPQAYEGANS